MAQETAPLGGVDVTQFLALVLMGEIHVELVVVVRRGVHKSVLLGVDVRRILPQPDD